MVTTVMPNVPVPKPRPGRRYDVWSTGKVQRVTVWASLFVIVMQQLRIPVGHTSAWQAFATWVQSLHV
jgi:hypothetical protein